jgi:hypothetical protein
MLSTISWSEYLAAVAILLGLYYTAVAILFYRNEIRQFINSKGRISLPNEPAVHSSEDRPAPDFDQLEQFIKNIDGILEAAGKEAGKEVLLAELKPMLASYTGQREPAYRVAVFNHIIQAAEKICGQRISAEELDSVVKG